MANRISKEAALYMFWNSFVIPAYEETSVPATATYPYITYEIVTGTFGETTMTNASVWDKDSDGHSALKNVNAIAQKISDGIGRGGKMIQCTGGALHVKRGKPFGRNMGDPSNEKIKRKVLNIQIEFLTSN